MNKNLTFIICFLLSLLIHILLISLQSVEPPKNEKQKKITYLDIQKKKKPEMVKEPDFLSDKDTKLTKKDTVKKDENKKPETVTPKKRQIPEPVLRKIVPPEKRADEVKNKKDENIVKKDIPEEPADKEHAEVPESLVKNLPEDKVNNNKEIKELSRNQVENILNPKDIIDGIVSENPGGDKDGEDDVSFNSMKFKYSSYFHKFKTRLYNVWTYPDSSILRGEEGTVRIKFSILKDGTITGIKVVRSSGYPDLDRSALDALRKMGKVPLSDSFDIKMLNVDGYFTYTLGFVGRFIE